MIPKLTDAFGGSITEGIAKIIQLFKVDPTIALEKQTELAEIQLKMQADAAAAASTIVEGQIAVNQAEAASGDKFTSRWRPSIGYICGMALFSNFIVSPFLTWISGIYGYKVAYPALDMTTMLPILIGMLGLGGLHVYENTQGGK